MEVCRTTWCEVLVAGRAGLTLALCGLMVGQPVLAETSGPATSKVTLTKQAQMQGQERVLHALNRFTFGPRPGEAAEVQAKGLNRWFAQQLQPAGIDDSAFEGRMAQFPAMRLSSTELEERYPGPQRIKAMIAGKQPLPKDPTERQLAQDQMTLYTMQKAKQEAAGTGMSKESQVSGAKPGAPASEVGKGSQVSGARPGGPISEAKDGADAEYARATLAQVVSLPPEQRMQAVLAMKPEDLVRLRQGLKEPQTQALTDGMSPEQKEMLVSLSGPEKMVATEAMESRLERDIYSKRELESVMTDFWLNHFNVYLRKNQHETYLIPVYERETIRAHALGNFEDLLVATAMSPAMLEYLDNFQSIGPNSQAAERAKRVHEMRPDSKNAKADAGLNENYGRELMELHTLGVNGAGYTQADVTNVAKVFTGWGIERPNEADGGTFVFDERKHEPGTKTVLGQKIKEDGMKEGLEVLHMLAQNPATAHFISQKLAVRFVSDDPPAALVNRMAASYLSSHGDIKAVLVTMYRSPEFWAEGVYRAKVKTPEEFVVSAVRASGAEVTDAGGLVQALNKLGMPLYEMQTPQGYSWKQDDWVSTGALVSRMNFALVLSGGRVPGVKPDWSSLGGDGKAGIVAANYSDGARVEAKERRLEAALMSQPVSGRTREAVLGQANDASVTEQAATQFDLRGGGKGNYGLRGGVTAKAGPDDLEAAVMAGLLLGSPEFQRR